MTDLTEDFRKPARKAVRAVRAARRDAAQAAATVAAEARAFSRNSGKAVKSGVAKTKKDARMVQDAAAESAEIAQARLHAALDSLQRTSEELGSWVGTKAGRARHEAAEAVQERPLGVAATIFAIGAIIGIVAGFALKD
jgi:ElaB/YqjD/DUF883 family membrane-anchored ribosome-binding protein